MKDGSKEEFECSVAIEFYNKIMRGVDIADQMANVCELDRKSCKCGGKKYFSAIEKRSSQLMDCLLRTQTLKNPTS
ncbi:hypothetical protein TNCT_104951 [Trichonephila clavata]|uniref:Uncharacterized protein n=1 Tax=Trichonephila clavata TaxID=2740835 RepID=A0A8X6KHW7_TRICU|nr:hypothetical protein TNCT_104951 [Trichonephila clavata]